MSALLEPESTPRDFSLLTYATHSEGKLQELLEAVPFAVVGGWGRPWKQYAQKFEFVLEYARGKPSDHIIVFVDGFDTEVRQPVSEAVHRFRAFGIPFLVGSWGAESAFPELIVRRAFACDSSRCANSGMYMGYAGAVCEVLAAALDARDARGDDQRALELARLRLPHIVYVDVECRVFLNLNARERLVGIAKDAQPVFVGRNGSSWSRGAAAAAKQGRHVSRLLVLDAGACVLAAVLGFMWGSLRLPTICSLFPVFPFLVGLCCLFSPLFTVSVASLLFLMSVFVVSYSISRGNQAA